MSTPLYVTDSTGHVLYVQLTVEHYEALVAQAETLKAVQQKGTVSVEKAYSVEEIRKTYASAYRPWTDDEEYQLKIRFFEDVPIKEIATALGRKEGAILSRLRKLGLL